MTCHPCDFWVTGIAIYNYIEKTDVNWANQDMCSSRPSGIHSLKALAAESYQELPNYLISQMRKPEDREGKVCCLNLVKTQESWAYFLKLNLEDFSVWTSCEPQWDDMAGSKQNITILSPETLQSRVRPKATHVFWLLGFTTYSLRLVAGVRQSPQWFSLLTRVFSTLAWKIPGTEEPGRLQSMGHQELDTIEWLHFHFSLSCIGEGNGNPLQFSCLENPRDGGAWWATVYTGSHRVGHDWSDLAAAAAVSHPISIYATLGGG